MLQSRHKTAFRVLAMTLVIAGFVWICIRVGLEFSSHSESSWIKKEMNLMTLRLSAIGESLEVAGVGPEAQIELPGYLAEDVWGRVVLVTSSKGYIP